MQSKPKRLIKFAISLGVFCLSVVWEAIKRMVGKPLPANWVILYYHAVPSSQREQFARQMDTLVRWASPIAADVNTPILAGRRYASVTFDDAFESVLEVALDELKKRRIPFTVFVIAGAMGRPMGWKGSPEKVMSLDQLQQLPTDLVTIGSHTMTHPRLPLLSEREAREELVGSRALLEEGLKRRIALFSFPYGAFEEELVDWCREAGYEKIFTTLPYLAVADSNEYVTGRVRVDPTDWPLEFRLKLLGAYRWLPRVIFLKRRLLARRAKHTKSKR